MLNPFSLHCLSLLEYKKQKALHKKSTLSSPKFCGTMHMKDGKWGISRVERRAWWPQPHNGSLAHTLGRSPNQGLGHTHMQMGSMNVQQAESPFQMGVKECPSPLRAIMLPNTQEHPRPLEEEGRTEVSLLYPPLFLPIEGNFEQSGPLHSNLTAVQILFLHLTSPEYRMAPTPFNSSRSPLEERGKRKQSFLSFTLPLPTVRGAPDR